MIRRGSMRMAVVQLRGPGVGNSGREQLLHEHPEWAEKIDALFSAPARP